MADELRNWVVVDNVTNIVIDRFQAPPSLIDTLRAGMGRPTQWPADVAFLDVTALSEAERPRPRWTYTPKGWQAPAQLDIVVNPTPPDPQRQADDAFIKATAAKIRAGTPITPAERDRLTVLQLERTVM